MSVQAVPEQTDLPPELVAPVDLIVVGRLTSFVDQVYAYLTQEELGYDQTSAEEIVAITEAVPFWPAIRFLTRLQRDLWSVRVDQEGQVALLTSLFGGSEFAARAESWVRQSTQRVLFSEQQVFALQRLVFLNSLDGPLDADFTREQWVGLLFALSAVPGTILPLGDREPLEEVEDEDWLRFFIGHGGFIGHGVLRNEFGRASRLYHEIAQSDAVGEHQDFLPLNEWLVEEYGLTFEELQATGLALHAGSKMLSGNEPPALVNASYFETTQIADKADRALDVLSAPREWFRERLAATQGDPRRAAFEITPFLQRPALRQPDGMVMPIAPRALEAWLGATGNYYRLFDIARSKGSATRKRYNRFNGVLVETYVADIAAAAYRPAEIDASALWTPGAVHRDRPYPAPGGERRTPDVVVDLTPDLIVIEVTGSRLTEQSLIDAEPEAVRKDIAKVLTDKIEQLGRAIADLLDGTAVLPQLEIGHVERIWPIVVSSEGLLQTPILWSYLEETITAALDRQRVQPLTLFDLEDVEELFGIVAGGDPVTVLRDKTQPQWQKLEFAAWCRAPGNPWFTDASPIARAQFEVAAHAAAQLLFGDHIPPDL